MTIERALSTRLGSYVAGASFFQSTITKQYNATTLLEDFKGRYTEAGCKGRGVAFIFTDKEIKEESFLEYINIFHKTGSVVSTSLFFVLLCIVS